MNILVYDGPGVSSNYLVATQNFLSQYLSINYSIQTITPKMLLTEPWYLSCSLLVIPGGRDLPYCSSLKSEGCNIIRKYVEEGGNYLGICAGSYFASEHCIFDEGGKLEVVGERYLKFFKGSCKGPLLKSFEYDSENGAGLVDLNFKFENETFDTKMYLNGGGSFLLNSVDLKHLSDIKVVARYEVTQIEESEQVAVLKVNVGKGTVLLSSVHFEYPNQTFSPTCRAENVFLKSLEPYIKVNNCINKKLLSIFNLKLNIQKDSNEDTDIKVTPIYVFTGDKDDKFDLVKELRSKIEENESEILKDSNDSFVLSSTTANVKDPSAIQIKNYNPTSITNLNFNFNSYYSQLTTSITNTKPLGLPLLHSSILTSTQTILEKNYKFQTTLPSGTTLVADRQLLGKGRGNNRWVSSSGCLQFSTLLRIPFDSRNPVPIAMLQYLFGLSVVKGLCSLEGYEKLPLKLKWPNDIYAVDGFDYSSSQSTEIDFNDPTAKLKLKKIGGILINSSFSNNMFDIVIGCGLNVSNSNPTLCINDLINQHNLQNKKLNSNCKELVPLTKEIVLATILNNFTKNLQIFLKDNTGFQPFLNEYYKYWLHSNQLVQLKELGNLKVKILGITQDVGELDCISVNPITNQVDLLNYKVFKLVPDGNSFDMMNGLILKKQQ